MSGEWPGNWPFFETITVTRFYSALFFKDRWEESFQTSQLQSYERFTKHKKAIPKELTKVS